MNVVFDKSTLQVVELNRPALPYEVSIDNVDPSALTKTIQVSSFVDKLDANGKQLYLLPQDPLEADVNVTSVIETTTVTNRPVMIDQVDQVPLLDAAGKQVTYPQTVLGQTTDVTSDPVMVPVTTTDANGVSTTTQEQAKDSKGNLLYWGQVPTGVTIPCYTTKTVQVQKTDGNGALLYNEDVTNVEKTYTPQPDLEITADDPKFIPGLDKAQEGVSTPTVVNFIESMAHFTYDDVVAAKEAQLLGGTLEANCQLYEQMDLSLFDPTTPVDHGVDVVSIPAGGMTQTVAISLKSAVSEVKIITESSQPLTISIGSSISALQAVSAASDVTFTTSTSTVFVRFENKNGTRTDLRSFALLY